MHNGVHLPYLLTMQDISVSSVERWHDVDNSVRKMKKYKIAQYEFYYSDFKFENVTCK